MFWSGWIGVWVSWSVRGRRSLSPLFLLEHITCSLTNSLPLLVCLRVCVSFSLSLPSLASLYPLKQVVDVVPARQKLVLELSNVLSLFGIHPGEHDRKPVDFPDEQGCDGTLGAKGEWAKGGGKKGGKRGKGRTKKEEL